MQDRQCSQAKEIHFEQAKVVQRPHRILRDDFLFLRVAAQRCQLNEVFALDQMDRLPGFAAETDDVERNAAAIARRSSSRRGRSRSSAPKRLCAAMCRWACLWWTS